MNEGSMSIPPALTTRHCDWCLGFLFRRCEDVKIVANSTFLLCVHTRSSVQRSYPWRSAVQRGRVRRSGCTATFAVVCKRGNSQPETRAPASSGPPQPRSSRQKPMLWIHSAHENTTNRACGKGSVSEGGVTDIILPEGRTGVTSRSQTVDHQRQHTPTDTTRSRAATRTRMPKPMHSQVSASDVRSAQSDRHSGRGRPTHSPARTGTRRREGTMMRGRVQTQATVVAAAASTGETPTIDLIPHTNRCT